MSSSLKMQTLSDQFNQLLTEYQITYQNFVNSINVTDASFMTIPNTAYITGNNIDTTQNTTLNECSATCSSTNSCSGATFDSQQNTCVLSSGTGHLVQSSNQTAIVQQGLFYSHKLQKINDKLSKINKRMIQLSKKSEKEFQENREDVEKKANILKQNYDTLEDEREQITHLVNEYETLNAAQENGSILVTSYYYSYIMYFIIVVILALVFIYFNSSKTQMGGGGKNVHKSISPLIFILLACIILYNASQKKA